MAADPPLSTLLSWALIAFTIELDNEFEHRMAAMLTDPMRALPHYPLVTHRGGWPDGS
jgi:hypothetical protein